MTIIPNNGRKWLIVSERCGRLANRIVLFANLVAFAEEHGCRLINFTFQTYADSFQTTCWDIYCSYPVAARRSRFDAFPPLGRGLRRLRLFYHFVRYVGKFNCWWPLFGKSVLTLCESKTTRMTSLEAEGVKAVVRGARVVFIRGFGFRAPTLLMRHQQKVRDYFRPVETIAAASRQAAEQLRQGADIVVGVHVRHGDYQTWQNGRYYYTVEQYADWMRMFAGQFSGRKVAFLVASNEARRLEEFPGLTVGFCPGTPVADLYALAECDYIIGPLSTFTQWASFYGNKPLLHLRQSDMKFSLANFAVSNLEEIP